MTILIADSSVLIDLERGGLVESAFACGLILAVPDLLYQLELEDYNGSYLKALGLGVLSLSPHELELAQQINTARPPLSAVDCFALCCALRPDHLLLTGDGNLRDEAVTRNVSVHGLLWLLDQILVARAIELNTLHEGLTRISADPRCRLPADEVKRRLKAWEAAS